MAFPFSERAIAMPQAERGILSLTAGLFDQIVETSGEREAKRTEPIDRKVRRPEIKHGRIQRKDST
jgi:hypothetical protein